MPQQVMRSINPEMEAPAATMCLGSNGHSPRGGEIPAVRSLMPQLGKKSRMQLKLHVRFKESSQLF